MRTTRCMRPFRNSTNLFGINYIVQNIANARFSLIESYWGERESVLNVGEQVFVDKGVPL